MINVGDAFKTLPIKMGLPNKEIGRGGLTEKSKDLLPPPTSSGIVLRCDEVARWPSPIGGGNKDATQ